MTKDIALQSRIMLQTFEWWGRGGGGVDVFWLTFLSQKLKKQRKGLFA